MDKGRKRLGYFSAGKAQLVSFDQSNNTVDIDMKMDGDSSGKSSLKMLWLTFSSVKLDWGSYIIPIRYC